MCGSIPYKTLSFIVEFMHRSNKLEAFFSFYRMLTFFLGPENFLLTENKKSVLENCREADSFRVKARFMEYRNEDILLTYFFQRDTVSVKLKFTFFWIANFKDCLKMGKKHYLHDLILELSEGNVPVIYFIKEVQ